MTFTASSLPRLFACPGSAALPSARTASKWADDGNDRHADQQDAIDAGDLGEMPEKVRALIPADATSVRAEVAVAYDVATGGARELGVGIGRSYGSLAPFEIPGTADLVAIAPGRILIGDWKGFEGVDEAERNEQTLLYALAFARLYGADEVTVAIAYLGTGRVDIAKLDTFDLDAYAGRLRLLHRDVAAQQKRVADGHMPDVSESRQCRYCPAAHACPAKVALLRRLVSGAEADELELLVPLDVETARIAYERLKAAKVLLKRIEAALYAFAAEKPIPLGQRRFFGKHTALGNEKLDGDTVYTTVRAMYGQAAADNAVIRSATKKRLKETLAAVERPPGQSVAAAEKAVLEAVRAAGGAKRETREEVGEFEASPQLVSETDAA